MQNSLAMLRCAFVFSNFLTLSSLASADDPIRDAVVKIHVTQRPPDFTRPWSKGRARETSGSGVIIDGQRILTNAHVVLYANRIYVQGNQSSKREAAELIAVAPEIDLAVIRVVDPSFYTNRPALPLATQLPDLKKTVNVYGFPLGGEQISITEGIISRIECANLSMTGVGVRIQIDAALNPGNSGGPAILDNQIVGLAFSGVQQAENIGYVIAAEEVERFLQNIPEGQYIPKPALHDEIQTVENEALRTWLKLTQEQGGLLITKPYSDESDYPLKRRDVITKLGQFDIDREGYVQVRSDLKLMYQYVVPKLTTQGHLPATIVRDGALQTIDIPIPLRRSLVMPALDGGYPSYFIHGPVLFMAPCQEFIGALGNLSVNLTTLESPVILRRLDKPRFAEEQLVILGPRLFPHATSEGYENTAFAVLTHINDVEIKNLRHAAEVLRNQTEEFTRLSLAGASTKILTFKRQELLDATVNILDDEGIREFCSDDLRMIWPEIP